MPTTMDSVNRTQSSVSCTSSGWSCSSAIAASRAASYRSVSSVSP